MQARALKEELPPDAIEVRCPGACVLLRIVLHESSHYRNIALLEQVVICMQASVRIFARHGQHRRAVTLFQSAPCKASVSWDTLQAVFAALLQANEPVLSMEILKVCFSSCLWSPSGRTCIMLNHS